MRTRFSQLALALLALAAAGCSRTHAPIHAIPGHFTNAGRIEAMLSVHAHHFWPNGRFPHDVRVIPLDDAARFIQADATTGDSPAAWSRRRRAFGEIAAVWLRRGSFRSALEILGVNPDGIRRELCKAFDCGRLDKVPMNELVMMLNDLSMIRGEVGDCSRDWKNLLVTNAPPNASHAAYTVKISVPRPVGDVAKAIDPQTWDHCSKFFCPPERTYLAHVDSSGSPVTDPPLTFGSDYSARTLYENFSCPVKDCANTTFKNILTVSAYPLTPRRQVTYDKNRYLDGSADGWSKEAVEIIIDGGQLWAEPDSVPGWTVAYADKTLLFHSDFLTGGINGAWSLAQQELASEFAEMACCAITSSPPTHCP